MASVAPLDTLIRSPASMSRFINWMVKPGSVVVLHDRGERGRRTAATLERMLPSLAERDFLVTSLSELDYLSNRPALEPKKEANRSAEMRTHGQP
jgi:hypothetical protein